MFCVPLFLVPLNPGERLLMYTDGLVESLDPVPDLLPQAVFQRFIETIEPGSPGETCEAILRDHPFFRGNAPQPDDFTVVMLERLPDHDAGTSAS